MGCSEALDGSAAVNRAMSVLISAEVPALANRYSICDGPAVAPARSSAVISPGSTQALPVFVTEFAKPTTVSTGEPDRPVSVIVVPDWIRAFFRPWLAQTTWSSAVGQCPDCRARSSTGPPGEARPVSVSGTVTLP